MEVSRRDFLRMMGISGTGIALAGMGCDSVWSVPDSMYSKLGGAPRIETWKTSVCSLCPGGCGIRVRLIDGIPVRITGNPLHPVNQGGICPLGEAGIESLFNPDRLKNPVKRIGERGKGRWEEISWEEALSTLTSQLQELRRKKRTHELVFWTGEDNSLQSDMIRRFMLAFGSPYIYFLNHAADQHLLTSLTQGHKRHIGYHLDSLDVLLNFGGDMLDSGPSPVHFNQVYARLRNREGGNNAHIVHIDSRLSRTAGNSSEWLPINPGTMAALALGIAHVMITDKHFDATFIASHTFGFEDWIDQSGRLHSGFKAMVKKEYTPEITSRITGITAVRIVELAREFGAAGSALALGGGQATNSTNGLYTLWAIDCLNALKGNYGGTGPLALVSLPPFTAFPPIVEDAAVIAGLEHSMDASISGSFCLDTTSIENFVKGVTEKHSSNVQVLCLADVNPLFNSINRTELHAFLKEIPFIVSFATCVDDTNAYADLILPDPSFLEKSEVSYNTLTIDYPHLGYRQPVVEPLYGSRHMGDVLLQVARNLGGGVGASLPWESYKDYLAYRLDGIYSSGAGTIFTEHTDDSWLEYLKERGWQTFAYTNLTEFLEVLADKGGWWDPVARETDFIGAFQTASRKYEFFSQALFRQMHEIRSDSETNESDVDTMLRRRRISARGDTVFLPHYEEQRFYAPEARYDLHLMTFPLITSGNGKGGNLPMMQELFGMLAREFWTSWIEVGTDTALKYGISDGDIVTVSSPNGTLELKAKIHPGVMPGIVYIPFGMGHKNYGRYARGIGVNPNEVLQEDYDFLSGQPSLISTMVELRKTTRKENT